MLSGLVLVILVLFTTVVLGQDCTLDDAQSTRGTCRPIRNCTFAVKNLHADIQPKICSGRMVCCPTEDTIAERKCQEWKSYLHVPLKKNSTVPLPEPVCAPESSFLIGGAGRDGEEYEFPHAVALGYGQSEAKLLYLCGGTLISDEYILTAAHCIGTKRGNPTFALLGDIRLNGTRIISRSRQIIPIINETIVHPNYRRPLIYNDIALLRLKEKVKLSRHILPACLPHPEMAQSQFLEAVGWGTLGAGEPQAQIIQVLNLTAFSRKDCEPFYSESLDRILRFPDGLRRTQICAGDTKMDTCPGDSGGPLTQNELHKGEELRCLFRVVGITSFGSRLCGYGTPGIYTKVLSYVPWIEPIVFGAT